MLLYSTLLSFSLIIFINIVSATDCERSRTTEEFKESFVGKCLYYQDVINPKAFCNSRKNCTELWLLFRQAFSNKPKCNVDRDNYIAFVQASNHPIPADKSIFYENVYSLVTRYSNQGKRLYSISDTLTGYIADNLKWCGSNESADGIEENYQSCPGYEKLPNCNSSAERAFWTMASEYYAKKASGKVHIMMNSGIKPSFEPDTYFATWELPNIDPNKVNTATILMARELDQPILETCSDSSIKKLIEMLTRKGIQTSCIDTPRDVLLLQCADSPGSEMCTGLFPSSSAARFSGNTVLFVFSYIMLCIIFRHDNIST